MSIFKHGHKIIGNRHLRFAQMANRFPVLLGMTIALALACTALILVIGEQKRLDHALRHITVERLDTTSKFCSTINLNSTSTNAADAYIGALIVSGAKQGKPFENLYRAYGFPPFKKRLRLAQEQSNTVTKFKVPPLDCAALEHKINGELRIR